VKSGSVNVRVAGLLAVGAVLLAGCANAEEETPPTSNNNTGLDLNAIAKDDALAGKVPAPIAADGKIAIGTDPTYAPNEFKDTSGAIIGFDVDLGTAIGRKLGLSADFQESKFDNIIPSLGSKYELGMSSFTDNKKREQVVDFVTYFSAGTSWAAKAGTTFDPEDACGHKVAVQATTVQDTDDLPARTKKCTDAGKAAIAVQKYDGQDEATNAVVSGKAEAMLADSPVTAYAIKQAAGQLAAVGKVYDSAPYGIAMAKGADAFRDAIRDTLKALIADGTYGKILDKWGLSAGAITEPAVNGAQS
jgi:polar amino acid transport system substrate-binding protein